MPRRSEFLTGMTLGTLTAATSAAAAAPLTVDRRAMRAVLDRPARHKQVISAVKIDFGAPLRYAGNSLNAFQFELGEGAGALHPLVVFYGIALFAMLDDAAWNKYDAFDLFTGAGDSLGGMIRGHNPFYHARSTMNVHDSPDDERGFYHDFSVEALSRRGVSWFVCNNALHSLARDIARQSQADDGKIYDDLRAHFVPGVVLVPAGVAAIALAQEARFTFLPGSAG